MDWLSKLQRKYGKYAIPNLMMYIICLNIAGFFIYMTNPSFYYNSLSLSMEKVFQGEVWRLFTFVLEAPATTIFAMFFFCLIYYTIGQALESAWGSFRFNLYYFGGVILHIVAAFVIYVFFHIDLQLNLLYLNLSLFLAFGAEYPDYQLYFFFFFPIKVKWLAILDGIMIGITIISGYMSVIFSQDLIGVSSSLETAVAATIALGNFFFYFFSCSRFSRFSPKQVQRRSAYKAKVKMAAPKNEKGGARHKCAICGRTDSEYPDLEFRFCSKCEGNYEYCSDHLYTHRHVTQDSGR